MRNTVVSKKRFWTAEEDKTLRERCPHDTCFAVARRLGGRTPNAVRSRVRLLGLCCRAAPSRWTEEEDRLLRERYGSATRAEIAEELGHTEPAVMFRIRKLGVQKLQRWSDEEDAILRDGYGVKSVYELAEAIDRPVHGVKIRARLLELRGGSPGARPGQKLPHWTEDEDELLRQEYLTTPPRNLPELASRLGRTVQAMSYRVLILGLRKKPRRPLTECDRLVRLLIDQGFMDMEVGRILGIGTPAANRIRTFVLGLPVSKAAARRNRMANRARARLIAGKMLDNHAAYAKGLGWPEWLSPRHVLVLHLLAERGPMTTADLEEATGIKKLDSNPPLRFPAEYGPAGSSLTLHLEAAGLVFRLRVGRQHLHLLTVKSIGLMESHLAEAADVCH